MKVKNFIVVLCGIFICSHASALEVQFKPYVGVDFSASQTNSQDVFGIANEDLTVGTVGLKFGADITDFWGIEGRAGLGMFDDEISRETSFSRSTTTLEINSYLAAFGKLQTPEYHGFRLKGLAGVSYLDITGTNVFHDKVSDLTLTNSDNGYETSFAYGGGVSYNFTEKVSADLEYLKLHQEINTFNIGLTYHF